MNELQRLFEKTIQQTYRPANVLGWVIAKKLKALGVSLSEAEREKVGALAYTRIRQGKSNFDLDFPKRKKAHKIELGAEDFAFLETDQTESFEKTISELARTVAKQVYREIKRDAGLNLAAQKADLDDFKSRLYQRWRKALDSLDLFISVARDAGAQAYANFTSRKFADKKYLITSLSRLHARGCQVASEIEVLLRSGYADGAHARWRTLHEISVVALLLSKHGEQLAERYWEHAQVESLRAAHQFNKYAALLGDAAISKRDLAKMETGVTQLCQRFGESFGYAHGWACELFPNNPRPRFSHLEELAEFDRFRPLYKMASHNVHAESKGAMHRVGVPNADKLILSGPSNAGLEEAGRWTGYSLLNITYSLISVVENLDCIVYGQTLILLQDDVYRSFYAAAAKLEADETRIRSRSRNRKGGR